MTAIKKSKQTFFFFFVVVLFCSVSAFDSRTLSGTDGLFLTSFESPSLLAFGDHSVLGSSFSINSQTADFLSRTAYSHSQNGKGFGLGYQLSKEKTAIHELHAAFGKKIGDFSLGSNAEMLFTESLGARLGLGATYTVSKNQKISVTAKNVIVPEKKFGDFFRELRLSYSLQPPLHGLSAAAGVSLLFAEKNSDAFGFRAALTAEKKYFVNPSLITALQVNLDSVPGRSLATTISALAGFGIKTGASHLNFFAGYGYEVQQHHSFVRFDIQIDPLRYFDNIPPVANLFLSDTIIDFYAHTGATSITFGLKCSDTKAGSGIANWTLVISSAPTMDQPAVRVYAGGSLPPSSIIWDGRNVTSSLVTPGKYYVLFSVVDKNGNVGRSGWHPVYVQD